MSFNSDVKEELSRQIDGQRHCRLSFLAVLTKYCCEYIVNDGGKVHLLYQSESIYIINAISSLIRRLFHVQPRTSVLSCKDWGKARIYRVLVNDSELCDKILTELHLINQSGVLIDPSEASVLMSEKECCLKAALRGMFLVKGALSDPKKGYHLELVCEDEEEKNEAAELVAALGVDTKCAKRKGKEIVYVKEGEKVSTLLGIMGATSSLLELENIRILRDISGNINRQVNCETANSNKAVQTGAKQIKHIKKIADSIGLNSLPDDLKEIAKIRLDNPDMPIAKIGTLLKKPLGKSGVYHRFQRIEEIADSI